MAGVASTPDLIIEGGRVLDGTGRAPFVGSVTIQEGRIASVGRGGGGTDRRLNASGMVVAPGFIDMHSHSDLHLLWDNQHESKVAQGVTTEVIGQDGLSYAPVTEESLPRMRRLLAGWNGDAPLIDWSWRTVAQYLDRLENRPVNVAYLVPHGTVRLQVMGFDQRAPTGPELQRMAQLVERAMDEGAMGISTGLTYAPAMYAATDELVSLCRVVADHGGYFCPHHRNYGVGALAAYGECIEVARRSSVRLHLAHAHMSFPVNAGKARHLAEVCDEARDEGVELTLDTYPYTVAASYLHACLPGWVMDRGPNEAMRRLRQPELRETIRRQMEDEGCDGFHDVPIDWSWVIVSGVEQAEHQAWVGRSIGEIADETGRRPSDVYCDLVADEQLRAGCLLRIGNEENVRQIMTLPYHTVGSDGLLGGVRPHPRGWGTFPRFLGRYVRELGVITLEEAVRHMTSLPATVLGLVDRGVIRPGAVADLVCFDPNEIADRATFEDPRLPPTGIRHVLVNGVPVVRDGKRTKATPGRVLRH